VFVPIINVSYLKKVVGVPFVAIDHNCAGCMHVHSLC